MTSSRPAAPQGDDDLLRALWHAFRSYVQFGANAVGPILHRNVVLEYPGDSPFSGTYEGRVAFTAMLRAHEDKSGGTIRYALKRIEREDGGFVGHVEIELGPPGDTITFAERVHVRFEHAQVRAIRLEFEDQAAYDAWWVRPSRGAPRGAHAS